MYYSVEAAQHISFSAEVGWPVDASAVGPPRCLGWYSIAWTPGTSVCLGPW